MHIKRSVMLTTSKINSAVISKAAAESMYDKSSIYLNRFTDCSCGAINSFMKAKAGYFILMLEWNLIRFMDSNSCVIMARCAQFTGYIPQMIIFTY